MQRKRLAKECKNLLQQLHRLLLCFETSSKSDESSLSYVVVLLRNVIQELSRDDRRHVLQNGIIDMKEAINQLGSQFLKLTIFSVRHEDDDRDFLSHLDVDLKLVLDLFGGNVLHATNVAVQIAITLKEENRLDASVQSHVICSLASTVFQDYLPKVRQTSEVDQWYAVIMGNLWLMESKKKDREKALKVISQVLPLDTPCQIIVQGHNVEEGFKTKTAEVLIQMNLEELKRFIPEELRSLDVGCTVVKKKEWERGSRKVLNIIKAVLDTAVDSLSKFAKQSQEKLKEESMEVMGKPSGSGSENCRLGNLPTNVERHRYKSKAGIEQVASMTKCTERKNSKKKFVKCIGETTKNSESKSSRELDFGNECDKVLGKNSGPSSHIIPDGEWSKFKLDMNLCGSLAKSLCTKRTKRCSLDNTPSPRSPPSPNYEGRNHGRVQCKSNQAEDQLVCYKAGKNKGMMKQVTFLSDQVKNSVENYELECLQASQLSSGRTSSLDRAQKNEIEDSVYAQVGRAHSTTAERPLALEVSTADVHNQELIPVKNDETDSYIFPGRLDSISCSSRAQPKKHSLDTKKGKGVKFEKTLKTQINNVILCDTDFEDSNRETASSIKSGTVSLQKEGGGTVNPQPSENYHAVSVNKFTDQKEPCNRTPKHVDIEDNDAGNVKKKVNSQGKSRALKNIDTDDERIIPCFGEARSGRSNSEVFIKRTGLHMKSDVIKCSIKNRINEIAKQTPVNRSSAQNDYERNWKVLTCRKSEERLSSTSAKPEPVCLPNSLAAELELGNAVEDNYGIPEGWRRIFHPRLSHKNKRITCKVDVKVYIPGIKKYFKCQKELEAYLMKKDTALLNNNIKDIFKASSVARANVSEIKKRIIESCDGSSKAENKFSNLKKTPSCEKVKPKLKVYWLRKKNYAKSNEDNQCEKISKLAGRSDTVASEELLSADLNKKQENDLVLVEPSGRSEGVTEEKVDMHVDPVFETEFTIPLENASCVMKNSWKDCVKKYNECNPLEKNLYGVVIERSKETQEELTGNNFSKCRELQVEDTIEDGHAIRGDEWCHTSQGDLNGLRTERSKETHEEDLTGNNFSKCRDTIENGQVIRGDERNGSKRKFDPSQEELNVLNVDCEISKNQNCKKIHIETSPTTTEESFLSALSAPTAEEGFVSACSNPDMRRRPTLKTISSESGVEDGFISAFSNSDMRSSPAMKTNFSDTGAFFIPVDTQAVKYSATESRNNACEFNVLGGNSNCSGTRITPAGMHMVDASSCILSMKEKNTAEEEVKSNQDKSTSSPCSGRIGVNCRNSRIGSHLNWEKDNIKCETDCRFGNSVIDFTPDYTPRIQRIKVSKDLSSGIEHALVPVPQSARSGNILLEVRYHKIFSTCKTPQLLESSCYVLPCEQFFNVAEHQRGCSQSLMNQFASSEGNYSGNPQQDEVMKSFSDSLSGEDFSLCCMPDAPESGSNDKRNCYCLKSQKTEREAQVTWKPSILFGNSNPYYEVDLVSKSNPVSAGSPVSFDSTILSGKPNEELVPEVKQSCSYLPQPKSRHCSTQNLPALRRIQRLGVIPADVTISQDSNEEMTRQAEYLSCVNTVRGAFPSFDDFLPRDLSHKCVFHGKTGPDGRTHQRILNSESIDPSFLTTASSIPAAPSTLDTTAGQAMFDSTSSRLDNVPRATKASTSCVVNRHYPDITEELSDMDGIESPSCSSEDMFGPLDLSQLDIEKIERIEEGH